MPDLRIRALQLLTRRDHSRAELKSKLAGDAESALPPLFHSIPDACTQLGGISRASLYRLAQRGELRTTHLGGRTVVEHAELVRFAREVTRASHHAA